MRRILRADRLPTFFVIGAPRSGTTSLYEHLNAHPEIYMSPVKEPDFFSLGCVEAPPGVDCGASGPTSPGGDAKPDAGFEAEAKQYAELFAGAGAEKCRGEASAIYLGHPHAAERIRHYVPDAKLIAILRDPADRLHSHYVHAQRIRAEAGQQGEGASRLAEELALAQQRAQRGEGCEWAMTEPEVWVRAGFYARHLQRFRSIFPEAQLRVFLFEDLQRNPQKLMAEIFQFLDVDASFILPTTAPFNASVVPKNRSLFRFFTTQNPVMRLARRVAPPRLRAIAMTARNRLLGGRKPPADEGLRQALVNLYREDIEALQALLGRDLSAWLDDGSQAMREAV